MIPNEVEYQQALEELQSLEALLADMRREPRPYRPDLELLGVRRLISRLHEELGQYEGNAARPQLAVDVGHHKVPATSST